MTPPAGLTARARDAYRRQFFHPCWASVIFNPLYFIRRGLRDAVRRHADVLEGVLLDFGCGEEPYREFFNVRRYVGLDTPRSGHPATDRRTDVLYDGTLVPFADASFDSVLCTEVFEHVRDLDAVLGELRRVLKPGGRLLLTMPLVWEEHEVPYDFRRLTSFGMTAALTVYGFEIERVEKTTTFVETVAQMFALYVYQYLLPGQRTARLLLSVLLVAPITLCGVVLSAILPDPATFYHNTVVLARKKA